MAYHILQLVQLYFLTIQQLFKKGSWLSNIFGAVFNVTYKLNAKVSVFPVFFKENVRYPVWTCRDAISLILGTRFSLILGTRFSILGTRFASLKHLKKNLVFQKHRSYLSLLCRLKNNSYDQLLGPKPPQKFVVKI